jgi:hypothetical protein
LDELRNYLELFSISKELDVAPKDFLDFASSAIFWREQAKFEFTKNVSHILNLIIEIGNDLGITREELAFLDVRDILSCYSRSINISKVFEDSINRGKKQWEVSSNIELPNLITSVDEIYAFTEEDMYANFITEKVISGTPNYKLEDLEGTIALIESADPGYDWIFGRGILALITAWGGLIHIWQLDVTS